MIIIITKTAEKSKIFSKVTKKENVQRLKLERIFFIYIFWTRVSLAEIRGNAILSTRGGEL